MAVRNFYVEAIIDGRETDLGGGPRAKDGGTSINFYQRHHGGGTATPVLRIRCYYQYGDNKLHTHVFDEEGNCIIEYHC